MLTFLGIILGIFSFYIISIFIADMFGSVIGYIAMFLTLMWGAASLIRAIY